MPLSAVAPLAQRRKVDHQRRKVKFTVKVLRIWLSFLNPFSNRNQRKCGAESPTVLYVRLWRSGPAAPARAKHDSISPHDEANNERKSALRAKWAFCFAPYSYLIRINWCHLLTIFACITVYAGFIQHLIFKESQSFPTRNKMGLLVILRI